jgi:hypothetical protein
MRLTILASCLAAASSTLTLTVDEAFTLGDAQVALRQALAAHDGKVDVTVSLAPGTHRVPKGGLLLTPLDTPAEGYVVHWRGSDGSTMSGGDNVTGWAPSTDPKLPAGVWRAPLPPSLEPNGTSRQFYVDGVRASRTSTPLRSVLPDLTLEDRADCPACSYATASSAPLAWSNPADVEFVYTAVASGWAEPRCTLESAQVVPEPPTPHPNCTLTDTQPDCGYAGSTQSECEGNKTAAHPDGCCWVPGGAHPSGHWCIVPEFPPTNGSTGATRLAMKQPCFWNLVNRPYQPIGGSPPASVENVRELLSAPGQWYLDRARAEVLYFPFPGQSMASASAVLAVEERVVSLEGAARQNFSGVTFAFATWLRPGQEVGYVEQQSAACNACPYGVKKAWYCGKDDVLVVTPGNVAVVGGADVAFSGCTFAHLGAYGASAGGGAQRVSWLGCDFFDLSAGALMLGATDTFNVTDPAQWDGAYAVADCDMWDTGAEYTGATTVFAGYVFNTSIEHNRVANASYSGMTVGWGWGREDSARGGNSVRGNHVQGVQTRRCCDGGGIYTLGPQPGSAITENYIAQGAEAGSWGPASGNGIYRE